MLKRLFANYTSEIDQFLKAFDREHPEKSPAQQYEITKYARINRLRDQGDETPRARRFWQAF